MREFLDYFDHSVDYPDPTEHDLTKRGWLFNYISSTFLNGWINYVKPFKAFVLGRYSNNDDWHQVESKLNEWKSKPEYHTELGALGDDVALLAKSDDGRVWFFYFDSDVSDCSIGVASHEDDKLLDAFEAYCREMAHDHGHGVDRMLEVPVECIRGWVKF